MVGKGIFCKHLWVSYATKIYCEQVNLKHCRLKAYHSDIRKQSVSACSLL